jgi:16S rRNA (uracil1498-N3)-methyltransferase
VHRHRCYIPDVDGPVVRVPDEQAHHLARVLRLKAGDAVQIFDGRGGQWAARLRSVDRGEVTVEIVAPSEPLREPPTVLTLGAGLLKGDQMGTVIRDATALGAAAIVPFVSDHVALPQAAWRTKSAERWRRIAIAAATQCGRAVVPVVHDVVRFAELVDGGAYDERWMCVEPLLLENDDAGPLVAVRGAPGAALVLTGPEGGWSANEWARAHDGGARPLYLGPRTLRAELAPAVALSVLWSRWGW